MSASFEVGRKVMYACRLALGVLNECMFSFTKMVGNKAASRESRSIAPERSKSEDYIQLRRLFIPTHTKLDLGGLLSVVHAE